jgi:hypothetical protein
MVPLATMVRSRFISARAAARHMIEQHLGVITLRNREPRPWTRARYHRNRRCIRRNRESHRKSGI